MDPRGHGGGLVVPPVVVVFRSFRGGTSAGPRRSDTSESTNDDQSETPGSGRPQLEACAGAAATERTTRDRATAKRDFIRDRFDIGASSEPLDEDASADMVAAGTFKRIETVSLHPKPEREFLQSLDRIIRARAHLVAGRCVHLYKQLSS